MKNKFLLFVFLLPTIIVYSQRIKTKNGNLKSLKKVNEYNLIFDYSNLQIPKYDSEEDFLKDKMAFREKRKAGDGERFKRSWFADRTNLYEPYFMNYFNDFFIKKRKIKLSKNNTNAKYTMCVKTKLIYPGYNVGFSEGSKLIIIIKIYETKAQDTIIFSTKRIKILNSRASFNTGVRIANSYGILGEVFAKYLKRKT